MDEHNYQKQKIINYLLGSLSVEESERFDQLSFTDDDFTDALDVSEKDLIDEYVRGELTGETLEKFKSHYLASPLRREKVSFAETLQIYAVRDAAKTAENLISEKSKPAQTSGGFFSFLDIFKSQNLQVGFAFATLLLLILGGVFILTNRPNREIAQANTLSNLQPEPTLKAAAKQPDNSNEEIAAIPKTETTPRQTEKAEIKNPAKVEPTRTPEPETKIAPPKTIVASFFLSPSMRGGGQIKTVSIPNDATKINVNLELETDDFTTYRVALTDESGNIVLWKSGKAKTFARGENKNIIVKFPAKLLKSKVYSLVVSGINPNGEAEIIGNYPFRSVLR